MNMKELEHLFKVAKDAHSAIHEEIAARQSSTEEKLAQLTALVTELTINIKHMRIDIAQLSTKVVAISSTLETCHIDALVHTSIVNQSFWLFFFTTSLSKRAYSRSPVGFNTKYFTTAPTVAPTIPPLEQVYRFVAPQGRYMPQQQFINGLRPEIRSGVLLHPHHSLEETYQKALELEEYLCTFSSYQGFSAAPCPSYSTLALPPVSQTASGTTSTSTSMKPR
ncbi:hypothetical protein TorRG33x02_011780 [Trema orientale]|uniref:Uncharacterized protein n=1 Tax=Trema orientale TaxID=63057 RepID=A0A2P5FZB6_TREOI|nr:hypothetical protein TorRG33x02_011780 [Trema orientale]